MFIRNVVKRFLANTRSARTSKSFKVSDRQESQHLQALKNTDYQAMRKKAVEQYNSFIKDLNQQYQKQINIRNTTIKAGGKVAEQAQQKLISFVDYYKEAAEHAQQQMSIQISQIKDLEKTNTVKIYLEENIREEPNSSINSDSSEGQFYIPKGFIIKKMYLCTENEAKKEEDPKKQVLLIGVDKEEDHCFFLNKLIQEFQIKNIVVMIPPDLPYFIKTEQSFLEEWKRFLENNDHARKTKFFINPKPKTLEDICLHQHHFSLVRAALGSSSSFIDTHYALLQKNEITKQFEYTPLLSPLTTQTVQNIYMADYPVFEERKMLADHISLQELRNLFQQHLANIKKLNLNFKAQWLFPQDILRKKLSSVVKIARQVASSQKGRTMLLCPAEMAELLGVEWQLGRKDSTPTYFNSKGDMLLDYYSGTDKIQTQQTFVEHIEKLVILDLIMQPVITRYFVKYRSFPFLCHHTIGGKQNIGKIFIVWMHYYGIYFAALNERRLESQSQEKVRANYMRQFQHPTNFT